jgi:hypothetical protein
VEWHRKAEEPTAAVLIRAQSNEQLTNILLALSSAVERQRAPEHAHEEVTGR